MNLFSHEYHAVFVILISVISSLLIAAFFFYILLEKTKQHFHARLHKVETNLSVLTSSSLGMGQKILDLEKRLAKLRDTQDEMKVKDLNFSYSTAEKLISQGVDDRAVAANSGLSSTEVNLMRLIQGQMQNTEAVHHA